MDEISRTPIRPVDRPVMLQRWDSLVYLHWAVDPARIRFRLPPGLEPDLFDGAAWVGLIPFHMQRIRPPGLPSVPWVGTFTEINVRTYVVDPDGNRDVWFASLDVPRAGAVAVARAAFGLPYCWGPSSLERQGDRWTYTARRRWPRVNGEQGTASTRIVVDVGDEIPEDAETPLERFLTARWGLSTQVRGTLRHGAVDHPPWPLRRATLVDLEDEFVAVSGLVDPDLDLGEPIVHASDGVDVRIGWLATVGS